MRLKIIKVLAMVLVFILLFVSCSNGKEEVLEDASEPILPEVKEDSEATVEEESFAREEVNQETTVIADPTENEIEFFNQLVGGFFYTKDSGDDYSDMRKDSINILNNQIITILEDGYDLYSSGIRAYEDKILFFIDDIDASRTQYTDDFQYIINKIMAYKTEINTLVSLSNGYFEKIENYENDDVRKAVIYGEIFETTINFYEKLDEYLLFLQSTREYLASGIIEDFNKDYALTLRQHTTEIFELEIIPEIIEVIKAYNQMSLSYVLINSGDYFYTKSISEEIIAQMEGLESIKGMKELKDGFIEKMNHPSEYLLIIENEAENTFRLPFIKKAYAQEYNFVEYNNFMAIHKFIFELSINPNISKEDLDEVLMSLVLQNHNVHIEKTKDQIEKAKQEEPELLTPETLLAIGGEKLMALAGADPVYGFGGIEGSIGPVKLNTDQIEKQKEINASKVYQETKQEIIDKEKREKMIEKIKAIQSSDEAAGGNFLLALSPDLGGDFVYDKVIKSLTNVLGENKGKMKGETFQSLNQLLHNDLEEILGSKKAEFANNILNASAEDLVNRFAEWVNNSRNRKDLEINKNNLITFLDAMGFEHEGAFDSDETLVTIEENLTEVDDISNNTYSGRYDKDLLLDYLSYMLPYMEGVNLEGLETRAAALNISKEEVYIYAMTTLVIKTVSIVNGKEKTDADEIRVANGIEGFLNGEEALDPWVRDYSLNMFYELFNERGDLDRWQGLSEKEKQKFIEDSLNNEEDAEEAEEESQVIEESQKESPSQESVDINDSNHFVFHRQDNGNVNAEHTFRPYNDEYMLRETITYHENGALESKGSILITIEASENMIFDYTRVMERQKNAKPGDFVPKPLAPARQNYFKIGLHERFEADGKITYSTQYDNAGEIILSKSWDYFDDGSLKKYREMDGNETGSITYYESEEYGGGKKYTDIFENNKAVKRINY